MPTIRLNEAQRDKLLMEHLPQVQYIAQRIHGRLPPQVLLEDLVHSGILGLIDAVGKYDPGKNVHLKHYAGFRIRGAILDSLCHLDWSPRTLRRWARRFEQAKSNCKARPGRDPSESEVAAELQTTVAHLQRLVADLRGLDIAALPSDGEDGEGFDMMQFRSDSKEDPYHRAVRSEMTTLLGNAMSQLSERERDVLELYHFQELTMKEAGCVLGIGESRVSQIHTAAMARLRAALRESADNISALLAKVRQKQAAPAIFQGAQRFREASGNS